MNAVHTPILQMTGITKQFPGVKALSNVSFRLFPGEIHALMGENGAGKSTLIKVLTGVYSIDEGTVTMDDHALAISGPLEAQKAGISTVYQEVNLCPNLTVAENIFIGREPMKFGRIHWKQMNKDAESLLRERLNLIIDVKAPLQSYSVAIQQLIAIARALSISAKVLILDEPTSSLDKNEVQQLFQIMRKLKSEGLAIVFVTHFLDQVYEMSDRLTVLRNGELEGEYIAAELPRMELVLKMIGKELEVLEDLPKQVDQGASATETEVDGSRDILITATGLGRKGAIEPFDLTIRKGEVVGLAGLLGSGRTEMARLLFGADRADEGKLVVADTGNTVKSPRHAIDQHIAFCSENRKTEGIIDDLTIRENIVLAYQATRGWSRPISRKKQDELAEKYMNLLQIHPKNPEHLIKNLSGGNQQKVLLARWLLMNPNLLILDEPTRGIDIGAKAEIQKLVLSLSKQGMGVLFISSELEEVIRVSDRVTVLRDRKKVKELTGEEINQQQIMKAMAGG
ncbi:sugar ABC transporter ATP-binding protein [Paenibacillus barcinonensis]|uniref:Simple sugar transport system ATP-binding protein n=1 Tax=Paenibacillus barcinonensis TaxID=198119 RepID=A0A2V4VKX8_PAEBA|nr:sugar ABC transporter ATP-binding protein [Paenibacillus barcinonensis]PYE50075.1 simple sugar transport system ATP-binding protein [Paenibacillus barcinonensis]QKS59816.1 sugar ABC transporter ATP-binding protein [Paenibacillus barcinonensis]